MKNKTLVQKIGLGYGLLVALLAAVVVLTLVQVNLLMRTVDRLESLRVPTSESGLLLKAAISQSEASMQGWVITRNESFLENWQQLWEADIENSLQAFESLAPRWTNPENRARLQTLKRQIEALYVVQTEVKDLATVDVQQAETLLQNQLMPLSRKVNETLNQMVENQQELKFSELGNINRQMSFLTTLEWLLLGGGVVFGTLLSVLIARSVVRPVSHAVQAAGRIASGDLNSPVNVSGSKELNTLGEALTNMRDELRVRTEEREKINWLSTGQNLLDQVVRGDKAVDELVTDVVTCIARYIGANSGALYLVDEAGHRLTLTGSFALTSSDDVESFRVGEGLIGQVAADKRPILLDNLAREHIRISSGLVDTPPGAIYIMPVLIEGAVLCVVEIGKIEKFADSELTFIDGCMDAIAVAVNSALARKQIQSLLEETQQQSEELQQQQAELEQTNEELEEQSQSLHEQREELRASNEELEEQARLIAEKNQSLEAARESIELKARELELSSKYKSEFLANMSHELRTPLNSLLILANELAANGQENLDEEQVESAQIIAKSGNDLLRLINDILDLSKVEAGKLDVNVSTIALADLSDDILRNFRRQAQAKALDLRVEVDDAVPASIQTDRQRLGQILNNLVSNAIKFTERGSISINIDMVPDGSLAIAVADTGIGIPEDKLDQVFEAFVQAEGGTSRKYGGTGLGLSISRELAKLLGGAIKAESSPGEGSTFTLVIPVSLEKTEKTVQELQPPTQSRTVFDEQSDNRYLNYPTIADCREEIVSGDRVLLIVEDDDNFASVLASQAVEKGFRHINAATGEDALALAAKYQPDAIILDVNLPGMDGYTVLRELKDDPELRHIPVHIISANDRSVAPIKAGAIDFLTKPVTRAQLDASFERIGDFVNRKVKNLLIVEDDEKLRKAIVRLIGNGDVTCLEANTGARALAMLEDSAVDCMVLDVGLPDMSGFELIKELQQSETRIPPIIIYTGRELTREENNELQQYTDSIIIKGVKSEERLLDETALFLHRTVKNLPKSKREMISRLYDPEEMLMGKKVLVVDDDMRNVFALSKVLKSRGMDVLKAENGLAALSVLEDRGDVDMVLMDIMMPEMDGYECMKKIRSLNGFGELPIIALTAKAMKEDREKCIDAGASDYIPKPVDVDRLFSLMRVWMPQ